MPSEPAMALRTHHGIWVELQTLVSSPTVLASTPRVSMGAAVTRWLRTLRARRWAAPASAASASPTRIR